MTALLHDLTRPQLDELHDLSACSHYMNVGVPA